MRVRGEDGEIMRGEGERWRDLYESSCSRRLTLSPCIERYSSCLNPPPKHRIGLDSQRGTEGNVVKVCRLDMQLCGYGVESSVIRQGVASILQSQEVRERGSVLEIAFRRCTINRGCGRGAEIVVECSMI
jgi:hypothetical protein